MSTTGHDVGRSPGAGGDGEPRRTEAAPIVEAGDTGNRAARPRRWGSLAGLIALGAGLGVAAFVAAATKVDDPIIAVGNRVIDSVPRWLKEFAVRSFGTNDKPVLLLSVLAVLVVAAAAAGRLAQRRLNTALLAVAVVGIAGVIATVTRTSSRGSDWLPPIVGTVVAAVVLWLLSHRPSPDSTQSGPAESPMAYERRRFLMQAGLIGVGAAGAGGIAKAIRSSHQRVVVAAARARTLPTPRSAAKPVPDSASVGNGVTPYVTPTSDFYRIDTALVVPTVDPTTWKMTIGGMVDKPLTINYDDLLARPMIERIVTLTCVSNEVGGDLIGNARFLGVPLADLLKEAGVQKGATQIASRSVDGWTCGFPTVIALDGRDAMVAVAMNGEVLPTKHGFPARLVVPGLYGYVSATKWLSEIRLTTLEAFNGYWIPRGWSKDGPIKTQSRIDVPNSSAGLTAGKNVIAGVAWAQHRGIAKVEVAIDGEWREAKLATEPTVDGWRQWWIDWDATAGKHVLMVRATDTTGTTQPEERTDVAPNGATGWHTVSVKVA